MTGVSYGGAVSYNAIYTKRYDTDYTGSTPLVITRTTANGGNDATSALLTDQFNIGDADLIGIELMSLGGSTVRVTLFDEYSVGTPLYDPPRIFLRPLAQIQIALTLNGSFGRAQIYFKRPNSAGVTVGDLTSVLPPAVQGNFIPVTPNGKPLQVGGATGIQYGMAFSPLPSKVYFMVQNVGAVSNINLLEYSILVIR